VEISPPPLSVKVDGGGERERGDGADDSSARHCVGRQTASERSISKTLIATHKQISYILCMHQTDRQAD
jgi:hypothetical protein